MADTSPEALWANWRTRIAEQFTRSADEVWISGAPDLYTHTQKDIAAQTWRNAARKISNMPMPPLPR